MPRRRGPVSTLRPCRDCGEEIFFVKTPTGKSMPLDKPTGATVVVLEEGPEGQPVAVVRKAYVSHFTTCRAKRR